MTVTRRHETFLPEQERWKMLRPFPGNAAEDPNVSSKKCRGRVVSKVVLQDFILTERCSWNLLFPGSRYCAHSLSESEDRKSVV